MELNKNASYKFNTNLIKLSTSNNIEEAKKEWEFILSKTEASNNEICICQHKVKHINYFYNIKNGHTIICGSKCCQKFNFIANGIKNKILSKILIENLTKGEYKNINCLLKDKLLKYFESEYEIYINNIHRLNSLLTSILEIIDYYNFKNLEIIRMDIILQIQKLERENKEKEIEKKQNKRILDTELINKYKQEYNSNIHNIENLHKILIDIREIKPELIPNNIYTEYKTLINDINKTINEYDSNIRMLRNYYSSSKNKNEELIKIIKYNMDIYNIKDINDIINSTDNNKHIETIENEKRIITIPLDIIRVDEEIETKNIWSCRFCDLSELEYSRIFFNDVICVQCARENKYTLAF